MIKTLQKSERIGKLRELYFNGPVFTEELGYFRIRRQELNYMRAYICNRPYSTRLRRAYADGEVLRKMQPVINDGELIVGLPDLSPLTENEQKEYNELAVIMQSASTVGGLGGHMALDYPKLLKVGVNGLLDEVRMRRDALDLNNPAENLSKYEFYECCEAELTGLLELQKHYAEYARKLADDTQDAKRASELREIAETLDNVPAKPAHTFREALQSIHFFHFCLWEGYHFGRMDQYLLPYYKHDIESGILTAEQAQELLDCFCLMPLAYITPNTSLNILVGGRTPEGEAVENEITWHALKTVEDTKQASMKISFAVTEDTSEDILKYVIELNLKGYTYPEMINDTVVTDGMIKSGCSEKDAHNYQNTGCVEMTVVAKSGVATVSPYHNLAQMMLDAMKSNADSFDELFESFSKILREEVFKGNLRINRYQLEASRIGKDVFRASCLVNDCLVSGKAVSDGGAVYNQIQPNFLGVTNVIDSFVIINKLVYESKEFTLDEFRNIIDNNYSGHEDLRQRIINKLPHFGTNEETTNNMAVKVTDAIVKACSGINTYRKSLLQPGAFSYIEHANHGKRTGATPDGRSAGYPLCSGTSPVQGREVLGPTASMLSCTCWNHQNFLGGVAINMKFSPGQLSGEAQEKMLAFVKVFMKSGGFQMQMNAVSTQKLIEARDHPEENRDLVVRVGGFSAHFIKLSPEMQGEIIDRNEHLI